MAGLALLGTMIILGIYVRISDDDRDEHGHLTREGVERQEADCRELAEKISAALGMNVGIRLYDDNNITAADERVTRPDFEQMLKDLEAGVTQGILFYHSDRVARLAYDAARVTRIFRMNPRYIGRSVTGGIDLSQDHGRTMFEMQAVMGGAEVSATRRRVTRKNKDQAVAGKIHGGKRPFGWEPDRKTLRPSEAELLRKGIRAIPKGKTVGTVRKEWVAAGVGATAEGKGPLKDHTVLMRLISPRVCGYRVYMSKEDRREAGQNLWTPDHVLYVDDKPVIGDWTPVVTPDEWKACVATLEQRRDKTRTNEFTRLHAKYLLSGIARCGECGTRLYGSVLPGDTTHRYRCKPQAGGCAKITRIGPPLDELVQGLYLEAVRRDLGPVEHDDVDDSVYDARIAELRGEIKEVMARRKPGHPKRISTGTAMDLVSALEAEIADLTYKSRALTAARVQRERNTPSVLAEWDSYTIDMKRDHLRRDIHAVVVNRAGKGARFSPDHIEVVWAS